MQADTTVLKTFFFLQLEVAETPEKTKDIQIYKETKNFELCMQVHASRNPFNCTRSERITNLCPRHESCGRSFIAYEACFRRKFIGRFFLAVQLILFMEVSRNPDLQLLSKPCNL